ncbi:hypothetical protein ACJZ2D_015661 [Fusarium nematophilum]
MEVVNFDMKEEDRQRSNYQHGEYLRLIHADEQDDARRRRQKDELPGWANLIRAQEHAHHPMLVELMRLKRRAQEAAVNNEGQCHLVGYCIRRGAAYVLATKSFIKVLGKYHQED